MLTNEMIGFTKDILALIGIFVSGAVIRTCIEYALNHWSEGGYIRVYKATIAMCVIVVLGTEIAAPGIDPNFQFILLYTIIILMQSGIWALTLKDL